MNNYVEIAKKIVLDIIGKRDITVFLYGSRADGTFKYDSDIDIGLLSNEKISKLLICEIKDALEESIVPYNVDITDFNYVSENFKINSLKNILIWKEAKDSTLKLTV